MLASIQRHYYRLSKTVCVLICLVALPMATTSLVAQESTSGAKVKTKRVLTVSQKNAKKFEQISGHFEKGEDAKAKKILDSLQAKTDLNNFERAYIANFLGIYYFDRDQLGRALTEFRKIVGNPEGLPTGFYNQVLYVIAQVYFQKEDYKNALKYAKTWFESSQSPSADAYMLVGQAHYMLKQYDRALPNVKAGIQKYVDAGGTPKEGWLNLLASIYRNQQAYKSMLGVQKQLVRFYPKKTYLLSLAGIYNELGRQTEMTAIYLGLYNKGLIDKESELTTLASLLMASDYPYKAASVIGTAIANGGVKKTAKHYKMHAQALVVAKEYEAAIEPLKKAASLSGDGKLYEQLGQSYWQLKRLGEAETALNKSLSLGGVRDKGQTLLSLGLIQFENTKYQSAKNTFLQASKYPKHKAAAQQWVAYVSAEQKRLAEINKPVEAITPVSSAVN